MTNERTKQAMPSGSSPNRRFRLLLLSLVLIVALAGLMLQLVHSSIDLATLPVFDFIEYWAAGRLNAHGDNPYDPDRVHELEREAGRDTPGVLMWNPPWTLPLVMPFGLLPAHLGYLAWLGTMLAVLALCIETLWRFYDGPAGQRWLAWLVTFTFLPTFFALTAGQIAPLVLLGAVAFLWLEQRGQGALAGSAAVLLAIKPHLSYLFWIALLLWALQRRRWSVLAGGIVTGLALTAIAVCCNPAVLGQYWHTITTNPPAQYRSPTLGTILREVVGDGGFGLQFVAPVLGLLWFVPYWIWHRHNWVWSDRLPLLLLVSMVTAAYGAWPFDLVLLLVPVLQRAAACWRDGSAAQRWLAGGAYLGINGVALVQIANRVEWFWFLWMAPALLLLYLVLPGARSATGVRRVAVSKL
jgi:hypothetical protein